MSAQLGLLKPLLFTETLSLHSGVRFKVFTNEFPSRAHQFPYIHPVESPQFLMKTAPR